MHLPLKQFRKIVASTPLISIDLIVKDDLGRILLGKRVNRPAKGKWFVPGGRIYKNEAIAVAMERLFNCELGYSHNDVKPSFLGVYEHFYNDSIFGPNEPTHYVVLAYALTLNVKWEEIPREQHSSFKWVSPITLLKSNDVHENTKRYFRK